MIPHILLSDKYKIPRALQFPISGGMELWSWLKLRSKTCRLVKRPRIEGIGPVSLLPPIDKYVKFFRFLISHGIDPLNRLKLSLKVLRFVKQNRVEGIGPPGVV